MPDPQRPGAAVQQQPGGLPGPRTNAEGKLAPEVGLVVKFEQVAQPLEDRWLELEQRDPPAGGSRRVRDQRRHARAIGVLHRRRHDAVQHGDQSGQRQLYVTNSEAQNLTRFEGPGAFGGSTVQGNLAQMRVTVISGSSVTPRHLNKHIDYTRLANEPGFDPTIKNHSLSTPLGMAVSNDGARLYIAAFGSSRIGVLSTAALENNSFDPRTASASYINVTGGGPSGIVLDEPRNACT